MLTNDSSWRDLANLTWITMETRMRYEGYPGRSLQIFLTIAMSVVFVLSVTGNSLICYIVCRRPAMRSAINLLLANLAFGDCLLSLLNIPVTISVLLLQRWPFGRGFCYFNGLAFQLFNTEKALVLVVIAVDRYFIIVKRRDSLNPFKAKWICATCWVLALFTAAPPVFGWGRYFFPDGCVQCKVDVWSPNRSGIAYVYLSLSVMVFLPCMLVLVVFYQIARTVRRARFRVQNHPPAHPTAMHRKGRMYIDYSYKTRTFFSVLLLSVAYAVCMFPLAVADVWSAIHPSETMSHSQYLGPIWVSYLHCALNSVIFYLRINRFREACFELVPRLSLSLSYWKMSRTRRRVQPHVVYRAETYVCKSELFSTSIM